MKITHYKKQLKDSPYCIDNRYNKKFRVYNEELRKEETKAIKCFKLDLKIMNNKLELRHLQSKNPFKDIETSDNSIYINLTTKSLMQIKRDITYKLMNICTKFGDSVFINLNIFKKSKIIIRLIVIIATILIITTQIMLLNKLKGEWKL